MAWATVEQVQSITGVDVTSGQLAQAQGIVEVFVDREYDPEVTFSDKDTRRLRAAVAWQAAYVAAQVDIPGRSLYETFNQDGMDITLPDQASVTLAPLAKRSILNLSWKRSRSVRMPSLALGRRYGLAGFTTDMEADAYCWRPL